MLIEKPAPTAEMLAEAARLEAEAARKLAAREESFARCDTDGFLSQWAHDIGAQRDERQAKLLRNGGHASFPVLCDAEGRVLCDHQHRFTNPYDHSIERRWRLPDDVAERLGRKWIPCGAKSRVQAKLGLHEESRWFPARAAIMGSGRGLSGCASAFVGIERIEA
jgi:hypothetical protein